MLEETASFEGLAMANDGHASLLISEIGDEAQDGDSSDDDTCIQAGESSRDGTPTPKQKCRRTKQHSVYKSKVGIGNVGVLLVMAASLLDSKALAKKLPNLRQARGG